MRETQTKELSVIVPLYNEEDNVIYIRAKRADTSSAWINSIFLAMNLLILLKVLFARWIKTACQPLPRCWIITWVLLRYRLTDSCAGMPGVDRDENAVLIWSSSF
jgi:hypothetical protein